MTNATYTTRPAATRTVNIAWLKSVNAYNGVARYSAADLDAYAAKVHLHIQSRNAQLGALTAQNVDEYYEAAQRVIQSRKQLLSRDPKLTGLVAEPVSDKRFTAVCPVDTCCAASGSPCRKVSGKVSARVHRARYVLSFVS